VIYFIQDSTTLAIKIGHAKSDIDGRRRQLQTGNPSPLVVVWCMAGDEGTEYRLHRQFAADRLSGEWFRPSPALLAWLMSEATLYGRHSAIADMEARYASTT